MSGNSFTFVLPSPIFNNMLPSSLSIIIITFCKGIYVLFAQLLTVSLFIITGSLFFFDICSRRSLIFFKESKVIYMLLFLFSIDFYKLILINYYLFFIFIIGGSISFPLLYNIIGGNISFPLLYYIILLYYFTINLQEYQ